MKINLSNDEIMGNEKSFMKKRKNGLMLSDSDIQVLEKNGINYLNCQNLSELLFMIQEVCYEIDDDELEELNIKLGEYNYYNYTNK